MEPTNNGFTSANVPLKNPKDNQKETSAVEKDEKYAQGLAQMAALDYAMEQKSKPETKHFISKKWLVYIVISLILTIISYAFMSGGSDSKKANDTAKTQQILNGTQELLDTEKTN